MKSGSSFIVCIIDRSGSMHSIRSDAIGGFNCFLEEQKKDPVDTLLTLVLFNHEYFVLYDATPIAGVIPLDEATYVPAGSTALLDAVGCTIQTVGTRLEAMPEELRPEKMIIAILTDGYENASQTFSYEQIASMIQHQREVYKWEFIFLAANQDAISSASRISIDRGSSFSFSSTSEGIREGYKTLSDEVIRRRPRRTKDS